MTSQNLTVISQPHLYSFSPVMKKPVVVHAKQMEYPFMVESREGWVTGKQGDYLMKGTDGEFYICDKTIFEKTYDHV